VYIRNHTHPRAVNGYVKRANLIAEQTLGRVLSVDEIVHHKNRDRSDDSPENLQVVALISDHARIHNPKQPKLEKRRYTSRTDSELVASQPCMRRYTWPTDEDLLEMRAVLSLRQLAKIIGCSFKAVDQHITQCCQKRGLSKPLPPRNYPRPRPRHTVTLTCDECGKTFERRKGHEPSVLHTKHAFCSRHCLGRYSIRSNTMSGRPKLAPQEKRRRKTVYMRLWRQRLKASS
jgi:hypothetical protein